MGSKQSLTDARLNTTQFRRTARNELSTVLSFQYVELSLHRAFTTDVANPVRGCMLIETLHVANPVRGCMFIETLHVANPVRGCMFIDTLHVANPVRGCMFIDTLRPESTSGRICEAAYPVGLTNSAGRNPGCAYSQTCNP